MKLELATVKWLDSGMHLDEGWASKEDYLANANLEHMVVWTVGLLMDEDDERVVVGLTYDPDHEHWYGAQLIARQNILEMSIKELG